MTSMKSRRSPARKVGVAPFFFLRASFDRSRPKGVELKHTLTQDDKELAAAGYGHLEEKKAVTEANVDIIEHRVPLSNLADTMATSIDVKDPGSSYVLTAAEAADRLKRDGPNILTPPKKCSPLRQYIDRLLTMFNILLIVAGILEYILLGVDFTANFANTYLGGILIAVAFLNAFIDCKSLASWYQVQKSEKILASFLAMIPPSCRVVRDGAIISIAAADLVKGDVVLLRVGDKTPADLVLFAATDLKVDNSSLTGESEPQERFPAPNGADTRPVEAHNLAFNSTLVVNGEAWGVVVRTGDHTFIGQIASLTGGESGNESPLAVEIGQFVVKVSIIAVVFAVIFFVVGITTAYKGRAQATVTFAVSILVAFVPEGLPSVVTLLLSIAAKRMANQNVLVKDLQGVETLGSLTLLATDKTGTLTRNQMTSNNDDATTEAFSLQASGMSEMVDIAALNSRVKFDKMDVPFDQRQILGDATETGLARFAGRSLSSGYDQHQKSFPKVFEVPFNSTNKWALVIVNKPHADGVLTSYIKGTPERVLAKCTTHLKDGVMQPITDEFRAEYDEAYSYMTSSILSAIAIDFGGAASAATSDLETLPASIIAGAVAPASSDVASVVQLILSAVSALPTTLTSVVGVVMVLPASATQILASGGAAITSDLGAVASQLLGGLSGLPASGVPTSAPSNIVSYVNSNLGGALSSAASIVHSGPHRFCRSLHRWRIGNHRPEL
ncbi:E1-E2 ATPase-domain-containing protein [Mycena galericulata]|nr:E1-E2 ATPase-domain-containing protein [Mycena galericulata]